MSGLGKQLRGTGVAKVINARTGFKDGSFPDLTGDGKVTRADVLKGRGVFKKGGSAKPGLCLKSFLIFSPYPFSWLMFVGLFAIVRATDSALRPIT